MYLSSSFKFSAFKPNFPSMWVFTILYCVSIIDIVSAQNFTDSSSKDPSPGETLVPQKSQFQNVRGDSSRGIENVNREETGVIKTYYKNIKNTNNYRNKNHNGNDNNNRTKNYTANGFEMVPKWIAKVSKSSSLVTRARTSKLLEKPLESLGISTFGEPKVKVELQHNTEIPEDSHKRNHISNTPILSPQISLEMQRLLQRKYTPAAPISTKFHNKKKRQDNEIHAEVIDGSPGSGIEFSSVVSPIESSLGGLTGLQGLPPLSPVQFIKLLVAVTPFIIPIIFIPLLIFTVGLLMIPVTKANMFVDIGDLRSSLFTSSINPAFMSSYIYKTFKTVYGSENSTSALLALPRALSNDIGTKLMDTEECVERISCEISARYIPSQWEPGNWRSNVNARLISRMIAYVRESHPTVSRIAKSLLKTDLVWREENKGDENSKRPSHRNSSKTLECARYTCHPESLFLKFLS